MEITVIKNHSDLTSNSPVANICQILTYNKLPYEQYKKLTARGYENWQDLHSSEIDLRLYNSSDLNAEITFLESLGVAVNYVDNTADEKISSAKQADEAKQRVENSEKN